MAKLSLILSAALIVFVAMAFVIETSQAGGEGSVKLQDCPKACDGRCSATQHKSECTFFCNYCCQRCFCVPSGTEKDRERAQSRTGGKGSKGKDDGLTPEQRRERDAKALQEKAAKKAAQAAGGDSSGGGIR
ncbi:unnamed protein product [Dovyalis caffra]|uniref:Small EDRK-rich factor-like N-terminal domain-containing protein n=1 Tax=Dovyalis caffra TaxID=77055 RepID=A0AAV1R7G5_9ROSI|nr:unnamed protein product [Dovyalis caffra]